MSEDFTTREVAALAEVSVGAIDKAVEEKVLTGVRDIWSHGRKRRMLPLYVISYAAVIRRLSLTLGRTEKRKLARFLADRPAESMTSEPLEIMPAVSIDLPRLVGKDLGRRASEYARARTLYIEENPEILGGTAVIRGTRISVHSLLGRIEGGDTIDVLREDYPELEVEAIETALLYARTHPLVGRPGGRPWKKAA